MKVRVLGCSGAIARDCRTTAFLVDEHILVDAGTGVGDLTVDEMLAIDHVLLTHCHLDHIAALPLMLDAVGTRRSKPLTLHALPETISALQQHIFNGVIWPDFSRLPSSHAPFIRYAPINTGQQLEAAGIAVEVLPAVHTVPAVGYALRGSEGWWAFSGDTGPNPALWQRLNPWILPCWSSKPPSAAKTRTRPAQPALGAIHVDGRTGAMETAAPLSGVHHACQTSGN